MLFSFVGFMVHDFFPEQSKAELGFERFATLLTLQLLFGSYYSGYLASSYFLAQFLTASIWGWLSDRWGRRPVIVWGLLGGTIATFFFGFRFVDAWQLFS